MRRIRTAAVSENKRALLPQGASMVKLEKSSSSGAPLKTDAPQPHYNKIAPNHLIITLIV
jgi:hypothetical protein